MVDPEFLISLYFSGGEAFEQKDLDELSQWIQASPENAERFARAAFVQRAIHHTLTSKTLQRYSLLSEEEEETIDARVLADFAEYEQNALAIEIPKAEPAAVIPPKVPYHNNVSLFISIVSAAALLFIVVLLHFSQGEHYSVEVATLVDQMDVKWADANLTPKTGQRLMTNQSPLKLEKGIIALHFDNGVDVVVEGPALFELERRGLFVEYGRLYCRVSESGPGFRILTPTSHFIDYGTEFGVRADINGSSELHVIKGKVQIFAGTNTGSKAGLMVTEHQAVTYHAASNSVKPIPVETDVFVRQLDSKTGSIWRGQRCLSLADMVGGGTGLSACPVGYGYDPETGDFREQKRGIYQPHLDYRKHQKHGYRLIKDHPFIDGVFIPDGGFGPLCLNSGNDRTGSIPSTSGLNHFYIANGPSHIKKTGHICLSEQYLTLNGTPYGTPESPGIYVVANSGITFDLERIRESYPNVHLTHFSGICGLPDRVRQTVEQKRVDVYIFLNDRLCWERKQLGHSDAAMDFRIPITKTDRYLTLVVTDSDGKILSDWIVFGNPVLDIEPIE